jgi:ATP-dependent exoDNAse (exonuclease V) alpha subunit
MKGITYALGGILIGGFCGLIFAGGEMNYVKKSQRGTFSPIFSIVFAVVGGGIGLGKEDVESLLVRIRKNKQALARWKTTDTLIIDEVSMLGPCLFEKLEELGRRIRRNPRFFGGIQLILGGDFFQYISKLGKGDLGPGPFGYIPSFFK